MSTNPDYRTTHCGRMTVSGKDNKNSGSVTAETIGKMQRACRAIYRSMGY